MQVGSFFTLAELTVTQTGLPNTPGVAEAIALSRLTALILDPLRAHLGRPVHVTSGYRSHRVNAEVGGEPTSQHLRGEAADIKVDGMTPTEVARAVVALGLPVDQLIVEYDDGKGGGWVHVSHRAAKNRGQLLQKRTGRPYESWTP